MNFITLGKLLYPYIVEIKLAQLTPRIPSSNLIPWESCFSALLVHNLLYYQYIWFLYKLSTDCVKSYRFC